MWRLGSRDEDKEEVAVVDEVGEEDEKEQENENGEGGLACSPSE